MSPEETNDPSRALRYFRRRQERLLETIERLVSLDTPTGDAERMAAGADAYCELLEGTGLYCEQIDGPAGPHIFARREGQGPPIAFVGHIDTVWPRGETARRPPHREGGRLRGPGVFDMKAGLGLVAEVARFLLEPEATIRRPLMAFVSADEELGSATAHPHMMRLLPPGTTVLVPEPPGTNGSLKIARKGVGIYEVRVRGRESHAGVEPEKGASAISEMARVILEVHSWKDPSRGISVNVGKVEGGTATNVVAGEARCGIDVRFLDPRDGEELDRRIRSLGPSEPGVDLEVDGGIVFPPLVETPRSRRLGRRAVQTAASVGLDISMEVSGGGSDGSFLASRGFDVLDGLGAEGGGAHAPDEYIEIDRLPLRAAFLAALVLELDRDRAT